MPTVSVIVPCYNHAPYLRQRMESILGQTFQDFELILLDDNSTDDSRAILDSYRNDPHVTHVVFNTENSGSPFRQWTKGVTLAEGEWIWIAESDDWAEVTFLEEMVACANRHRQDECCIVSTNPIYVYPDGKRWNKEMPSGDVLYVGSQFIRERLSLANTLPNASALLLRRSSFLQIDTAETCDMRVCGDWMLYLKMCTIGSVVEMPAELSYFRQHGNNTSLLRDSEGRTIEEWCHICHQLASQIAFTSTLCKQWGKQWAKQERAVGCVASVRHRLRHLSWPSFWMIIWHDIYRTKYLWQR